MLKGEFMAKRKSRLPAVIEKLDPHVTLAGKWAASLTAIILLLSTVTPLVIKMAPWKGFGFALLYLAAAIGTMYQVKSRILLFSFVRNSVVCLSMSGLMLFMGTFFLVNNITSINTFEPLPEIFTTFAYGAAYVLYCSSCIESLHHEWRREIAFFFERKENSDSSSPK